MDRDLPALSLCEKADTKPESGICLLKHKFTLKEIELNQNQLTCQSDFWVYK